MKRRRIKSFLRFFLLILIAVAAAYLVRNPEALRHLKTAENHSGDGRSIFSTAMDLIMGEPEEVRKLKKAVIEQTQPGRLEYYFNILQEDEKRLYRQLQAGIETRKEEFYLTSSDSDEISHVYEALLNDHPELFWVKNRETKTTSYREGDNYCQFSPGYSYTEEEIQEAHEAIEKSFREVMDLIPANATDYQKAETVYTYIIDSTEYQESDHDQNIAGVFWKKEAVCAGYAAAAQFLLERLRIPCIYVSGDARGSDLGHAWNVIMLDGEYYYMDTTNGDQPEFLLGDIAQLSEHKTTLMDYLCPFPEEYEMTYTASASFPVPACTSHAMNFYVLNGACFDTYDWQNVYDLCVLRIDNQAAVIRLKFGTEEAFEASREEWIDSEGSGSSAVAQYYMRAHGLNHVDYHRGILKDMKTIYYIF